MQRYAGTADGPEAEAGRLLPRLPRDPDQHSPVVPAGAPSPRCGYSSAPSRTTSPPGIATPEPFTWTATADEILAKARWVHTEVRKLLASNDKHEDKGTPAFRIVMVDQRQGSESRQTISRRTAVALVYVRLR
jgi:hypothetical protein